MSRRRRIAASTAVAGALAALLTACGDTPIVYPHIKFVGNDTCPTTVPTVSPEPSPAPSPPTPYEPSPPEVNGTGIVGQAIDEMPHFHVEPPAKIQYNHDPPTSGCHYSIAQQAPVPPGSYNSEIPAEYWVHNLEHGYVVVLYNCPTGCASDFQKLVAWRKSLPPDPAAPTLGYAKVLVLPWHTMPKKFAAVSWDYYQGWDSLDIDKVQAFYDNHVGHAPEGAMTG
jgi:hypothetical protein